MATTVTTNGTVGTKAQFAGPREVTDLPAISLDGLGTAHNRMRGTPRAFEALLRWMPAVRASGIPFGFIVTLTLRNAADLDALARLAVDEGATYARTDLVGEAPDEREAGRPARG